jgi:hypothetical protein
VVINSLLATLRLQERAGNDADSSMDSTTVYDRLYGERKRVEELLEAKRRELQHAEVAECSFAPRTNSAGRRRPTSEPPVRVPSLALLAPARSL